MERFIGSSDLERSMQSSRLTPQWTHMSIVIKNCTCRLHHYLGKANREWKVMDTWSTRQVPGCKGWHTANV
jgi:hypothetical protein